MLYYYYYQDLLNQIQNPIYMWEEDKPIFFQLMYSPAIIINN